MYPTLCMLNMWLYSGLNFTHAHYFNGKSVLTLLIVTGSKKYGDTESAYHASSDSKRAICREAQQTEEEKRGRSVISQTLFNQVETLCCGEGGSISAIHIPIAHAAFLISSKWTTAVSSLEARKLSAKKGHELRRETWGQPQNRSVKCTSGRYTEEVRPQPKWHTDIRPRKVTPRGHSSCRP